MGRRKSFKYQQASALEIVIQSPKPFFGHSKGHWRSEYFKNDFPIVLELGCGKGEYTNGLARLFPDKNFVGIDIKGDRMASGAIIAHNEGLKNVAFLRIMMQFIDDFFDENEVDEIWITFPDPRPKDRDEKKRLTFPTFLQKYKKVLKPNGLLHVKTDADSFYEFTKITLAENQWPVHIDTTDLYQSEWNDAHFGIKTRFETIFHQQGFSIKYVRAINQK